MVLDHWVRRLMTKAVARQEGEQHRILAADAKQTPGELIRGWVLQENVAERCSGGRQAGTMVQERL